MTSYRHFERERERAEKSGALAVRALRISQSRDQYTNLNSNGAPPPLRVRGGLATLEMTGSASSAQTRGSSSGETWRAMLLEYAIAGRLLPTFRNRTREGYDVQ